MADDRKRKKSPDGDAWGADTPDGILDDEDLLSSLESGEAADTELTPAKRAQARRAAATSGSSEYEQNTYDSAAMFRDLTDPEPPPRPSAPPQPSSPEVKTESAASSGFLGSLFGKKKSQTPAAVPEPQAVDEEEEVEALAPVRPRVERAVFEPGGSPSAMEQRPVTEVRSKNTRIKRPRRGGLTKKFLKFGFAVAALVIAAGAAIYYGYHEKLPVDQKTKDTMSKSVKDTKEKLDRQLENLEDLAERTKAKAAEGLEQAEEVMLKTEETLKEMGQGQDSAQK